MTKVRVHELAKELGMESKQLIQDIKSMGIDVKTHQSTLDTDQVSNIKQKKGGSLKTEAPKVDAPKTQAPTSENAETEAPKKKNIVHVFRPQNTKSGGRPVNQGQRPNPGQGQRPQGQRPNPNAGQRPVEKPAEDQIQAMKPTGEVTPNVRPSSERPQSDRPVGDRPQDQRPVGDRPQGQRPVGDRPQGQRPVGDRPQGQRPVGDRPQGQRPVGDRPQGQRPVGDRPQGQRPVGDRPQGQRPYGDRPQGQRPYGDRPQGQRPVGDRPQGQRPYGDRPQGQRPYGDRPQGQRPYGDRPQGQRPYGDRPQGQRPAGDRPQGQRPYGDRPQGQRPYGDRPQGQRPYGDRPQGQRPYGDRPQGQRPAGGPGAYAGRPGGPGAKRDDRTPITSTPEGQKAKRSNAKERNKQFHNKDAKGTPFGQNVGATRGRRPNQRPIPGMTKPKQKVMEKPEEKIKSIILPEILTIKELADKMKIVPSVIVKKLFLQGKIVTVNQEITYETAEEIALEFEVLCEKEIVIDVIEELLKEDEEADDTKSKRPPVVCVMGHVDHGKTSLLDAIRETNVTDRESGGITQHIGAYMVEINGEKITFLDTPGHEAFTAMRMRGASSTDVAILVVAADDGVMPQTIEAISHAKAAGVEIIVAINKIDKPSANIERVKQELSEYELIPSEWGGSTTFVPVSAKSREGITDLLEMILLTAEVLELKANPDREARGIVIEAQLDKGKGSVATVLVQKGTLHIGDAIAAGSAFGKVRAMINDKGQRVTEAGPSVPVEILGLNNVPNAGEVFVGCKTEKEARSFGETFISHNRVKLLDETKAKMSLDDLFSQIKEGNLKELNLIVKADVQGSVEALKQSLLKLSNEEVIVKIIHGGVGAINESDVSLASTSNAIIIGFNVRPDVTAKEIADREGVDLRLYKVIYAAIDDVEKSMKGMLDPIFEEKVIGEAIVRQIFTASGIGTIAGSYVTTGTIERGCSVRITREGKQIYEGPLASLKRFKDDVKEVRKGYECGLVFDNFNDLQEDDQVEAYKMVEVERK